MHSSTSSAITFGPSSGFDQYPSYLLTEARPQNETLQQFKLRRLNEELSFFGSLALPENQGVKLEITNRARKVTRVLSQYSSYWLGQSTPISNLPNNVYCFSGVFGNQATSCITRAITGASVTKEFIDSLKTHLNNLANDIPEAAQKSEGASEGLALNLKSCIKGLKAYRITYSSSQVSDKKKQLYYTSLIQELSTQIRDYKQLYRTLISVQSAEDLNQSMLLENEGEKESGPAFFPSLPARLCDITDLTQSIFLDFSEEGKGKELIENEAEPIASTQQLKESAIQVSKALKETFITVINNEKTAGNTKPAISTKELHIPQLVNVSEIEIQNFVDRFLHQFITGQVTKENVPENRQGLMDILSEQARLVANPEGISAEQLEMIAFSAYVKKAAIGLSVQRKDLLNHEEKIEMLAESLFEAIPVDFPKKMLNKAELTAISAKALKKAGKTRKQEGNEKQAARRQIQQSLMRMKNVNRPQQILSLILENNEGKNENEKSWFL